MASGYGKKSIKSKFNNAAGSAGRAIKKLILGAVFLSAAATPAYYQYGTFKEQDVTVTSLQDNTQWNYEHQRREGGYAMRTDKGNFLVEPSQLHLQNQDKVDGIWQELNSGKTYHIKTYGMRIGDWQPNVIAARELTPAEMKMRDVAKVRADSITAVKTAIPAQPVQGPVTQPAQPAQTAPSAQPTEFSGEVHSCEISFESKMVRVSAPKEVDCRQVKVVSVVPIRPPG